MIVKVVWHIKLYIKLLFIETGRRRAGGNEQTKKPQEPQTDIPIVLFCGISSFFLPNHA